MFWKAVCAVVATAAYGIVFNLRGKNLVLTGINGGLGYFVYALIISNNYESYIGMFFASTIMTIFAEVCARKCKAPASVFLAGALIPIVPGGGLFSCVMQLLEGNNAQAVVIGIKTLFEAGAIAIAIIVISSLTKVVMRCLKLKRM